MKRSWAARWLMAWRWARLLCVCVGREDGGGRGRDGGRSLARLVSCSGVISCQLGQRAGKAPALAPCVSSPAALREGWDPHRGTHGIQKKRDCPQIALSHTWSPENKINKCVEGQVSCGVTCWETLAGAPSVTAGARCAPRCLCQGRPARVPSPSVPRSCTEPGLPGQVEENLFSSLLQKKKNNKKPKKNPKKPHRTKVVECK